MKLSHRKEEERKEGIEEKKEERKNGKERKRKRGSKSGWVNI